MTKNRFNLSDVIDDYAPKPPPCFFNNTQWIQYLKSCAGSQNDGDSQKIVIVTNGIPKINYDYKFCADCDKAQKTKMQSLGRCSPGALKDQRPDQ